MTRWFRLRLLLDRLLAAVLLLAVLPLVLALAMAVRAHDRGPGLITVPRVGRNGVVFGMWKLRSMRADRGDGRALGVSLTTADDDRITPLGRWMRAWYLDEIPQLINVVRGEMALLGARPEAPEFVDHDDPRWKLLLEAPPGLAGPTQLIVNDWERDLISDAPDGSTYVDVVLPVKLAIDGWYTRSASPKLDALVAITLVRRFIPGTGSYTLKKLVRREVAEAAEVPLSKAERVAA